MSNSNNDRKDSGKEENKDTRRGDNDQLNEKLRGPASSTTTSDVRPSKAGKAGREGGSGINISDHETEDLNNPSSGAAWSGQKGMGPETRDKDHKEKISPTNVERRTSEDE